MIEGPRDEPAQAETLLDEAGWRRGPDGIRIKDGQRLHLTMINGYPPIDMRKPMPELVQARLRELGIEVEIVETPDLGAAGPVFDRLVEESRAADDREVAKQKAAEGMHVAIDEETVVIPVAAAYWLFLMKDNVQGFVPHGSARHVTWASVYRSS